MIPKVFLSLSGKDDAFVDRVARLLPDGLAFFYKRSFENGSKLLDAMESGVDQSSVFVFFASHAAIASKWTGFEIDRARLAKIVRPNFRILVFPLEASITPSMLPEWMQQYWVPRAGFGPKDVARYIRHLITSTPLSPPAFALPVIGRGQLLDLATQRTMAALAETHHSPNIIIAAGIAGIGRRTFIRHFCQQTMPALPTLVMGPELQLPQFADLADLYRGLREQIEVDFSLHRFEDDLQLFQRMSVDEQTNEVVSGLEYFSNLGQAVFVATGSGLFEDRGNVKEWIRPLFDALGAKTDIKLCLITNRQFRDEDLRPWSNVIQFAVPPLRDADIRALMTATSTVFGITPVSPNPELIRSIGGHPDIAKSAVRLIAQRGLHILEREPTILYGIQEAILGENLDVQSLTDMQQKILCVLSWVPQLDGRLLEKIVSSNENDHQTAYVGALENLILGCLVIVSDLNFLISPAIRQMFRRKYGFGPEGLLTRFSSTLASEWAESLKRDEFRSDLFDAFVFMHALEGHSLPGEFRNLLLPSTLEEVTRQTYDIGRQNDDANSYRQVTSWGQIALEMNMDESVREEILATVVRAHVRLGEYRKADELLSEFDRRGYRMGPFLRGFSLRRQDRYRDAIPYLREAMATRRLDRSAVQELALCFQKLGMTRDLEQLVRDHENLVSQSASLLDFRIGILLSEKRFEEAQREIVRLKAMPDDEGRSTIRKAQLLFQKDNNPVGAEDLLSGLVKHSVGDPVRVRRWRAMAAAAAGKADLARRDIEFIRARQGRQSLADRLEVYFALAQQDYGNAEAAMRKLGHSASDELLRARLFEAKANDGATPLAEREDLRMRAAELRAMHRHYSEFDFD